MPFTDQATLKAFASKNSWLTATPAPEGLSEAIAEADDMIYQYTGVAAPAAVADASPTLRAVACAIVVWITTGMQGEIKEKEYQRRRDLYLDAIQTLKDLQGGRLVLRDSAGDLVVDAKSPTAFTSDQKITSVP